MCDFCIYAFLLFYSLSKTKLKLKTKTFSSFLESGFMVRSIETGLGRWMLVVAVINVDAYPFLAFSDLTCHLEGMGIGDFWLHCAT